MTVDGWRLIVFRRSYIVDRESINDTRLALGFEL